jgi:hypothetical protein
MFIKFAEIPETRFKCKFKKKLVSGVKERCEIRYRYVKLILFSLEEVRDVP